MNRRDPAKLCSAGAVRNTAAFRAKNLTFGKPHFQGHDGERAAGLLRWLPESGAVASLKYNTTAWPTTAIVHRTRLSVPVGAHPRRATRGASSAAKGLPHGRSRRIRRYNAELVKN